MSTSFLRGTTLDDCIIIVDEAQNLTFHELDSIITRVGVNSQILFCGDCSQTDLDKPWDQSGLNSFMAILDNVNNFEKVEFSYDDIVRSGLVRDYLIAKDEYLNETVYPYDTTRH
jgi:phosphate starvation-inducible protein PhoH